MIEIVPMLSFVLPIIAGCLVFTTIATSLYFRIRNRFHASVNCWFCDEWTKVLYSLKDSFICPHCLQYNGFSKDGDYNKIIPEQHDELLNKGPSSLGHNHNKTALTNGLCTLCNNNQQLKVLQLARFVPMCEENYDREIEHFQTQLEKAYKLCKKCDKVLKKTINKQSSWIFGNRIKTNSGNKSSPLLKNSKSKLSFLIISLNSLLSILINLLILWTLLHNKFIYKKFTTLISNSQYLPILKDLMLHGNGKNFILKNYVPWIGAIDNYTLYCCVGFFFQSGVSIISRNSTTEKMNQLLCWTILILTSTFMRLSHSYTFYVFILQLMCYGYMLAIKLTFRELKEVKGKKKSLKTLKRSRKLVNSLENTCSDFSDLSENEVSASINHKNSSQSFLEESFNHSHLSLNDEPIADRSSFKKSLSTSFKYDPELNTGLNNLNLGPRSSKSPAKSTTMPFSITNVTKRPKPVLSPAKFQGTSFNSNSWVAGGYWQPVYVNQPTNLSRSSSESSGFGSQVNENNFYSKSLRANSPKNSICGDFDRASVFSEPVFYNVKPTAPSVMGQSRGVTVGPFSHYEPGPSRRSFIGASPVFVDRFGFQPVQQERSLFKPWQEMNNSLPFRNFGDLPQLSYFK